MTYLLSERVVMCDTFRGGKSWEMLWGFSAQCSLHFSLRLFFTLRCTAITPISNEVWAPMYN